MPGGKGFVSRQQARMAFAQKKSWAQKWADETNWEDLPETADDANAVKRVRKKLESIKRRKDA